MTIQFAQPQIIPIVYSFAYNTANIGSGVQIATLPIGCYLMGIDVYVDTAFNPGALGWLDMGFSAGANEYVFNQDLKVAGKFSPTRWSGNIAWPLAANRAVYAKFGQTGAAATAGAGRIVMLAMKNTL